MLGAQSYQSSVRCNDVMVLELADLRERWATVHGHKGRALFLLLLLLLLLLLFALNKVLKMAFVVFAVGFHFNPLDGTVTDLPVMRV